MAEKPFVNPRFVALGGVVLVVAIGAAVRLRHLDDVASRTPDERVYTNNAHRISSGGFGEFPALIREYNGNQAAWAYPSPSRVGYLALLAGVMRISGVTDERAGAGLACLASIASLSILAIMGVRLLPLSAAIFAIVFLSFSVVDLAIARRCWQDGCLSALGLLMAWPVCEITRNPKSWGWYAVLVGFGTFAALVKESAVFVYGGCLLFVTIRLAQQKEWSTIRALLLAVLIGASLCLCCLILAAGGWPNLLATLQNEHTALKQFPYAIEYQSGPWFQFAKGYWILDPLNVVLGLFAAVLALIPLRYVRLIFPPLTPLQVSCLRLFCWMTALFIVLILMSQNTQNFRYIAPVFGPMYLMSGFGLWALLQLARNRLPRLPYLLSFSCVIAVMAGSAFASYRDFERVYVEGGSPDLSIRMVLDSHRQ